MSAGQHTAVPPPPSERHRRRLALLFGLAALAACAVGGVFDPAEFFRAYLIGAIYWAAIAVGAVAVLMVHHLTTGRWGYAVQRLLESAARTLPVLLLLFVPLAFGLEHLYAWSRAEAVGRDPLLQHKSAYLSVSFSIGRTLAYFAVWITLAYLLSRWSRLQDRTGEPQLVRRLQRLSGPGLVLYVLTVHYAAIDWVMSLDPHWYSTIFGAIFICAQGLSTFAFAVVVLWLLRGRAALQQVANRDRFHDLGNMMLAFVLLWAYVSFSQLLIIWSGNVPEEITWYIDRRGDWLAVAVLLVALHFALPFAVLLFRGIKRRGRLLASVAMLVLVARWLDVVWLVVPGFSHGTFHMHWMYLLAPLGIGGVWLAAFLHQLDGVALVPQADPRMPTGVGHA